MPVIMKEFEHIRISLGAIESATNSFSAGNRIGKGGFGEVYKGELKTDGNSTCTVAVKRLDHHGGQGDPQFWKEIQMLSNYKHENIVSLLGFCDENGEKILVYEYAYNKSLDFHLGDANLNWIQRLNICLGAVRGLEYLHDPNGTQQRIIHRDVKSSNILLDENMKPKIADFGLCRLGPANPRFLMMVTGPVGTIGYCDPLYAEGGFLTKESDVYSFGVVLFEVLGGRLCFNRHKNGGQSFVGLARQCVEQKKLNEIVYDRILFDINPESLEAFAKIAYECLNMVREERPTMTQIVNQLEIALQLQNEAALRYDFEKLLFGCKHYRNRCKLFKSFWIGLLFNSSSGSLGLSVDCLFYLFYFLFWLLGAVELLLDLYKPWLFCCGVFKREIILSFCFEERDIIEFLLELFWLENCWW